MINAQKALRFFKRKVIPQSTHFWEYYGRIKFASDAIKKHGHANVQVLDVGGATGNNLLKQFGINNVKTLDLKPGADITASATEIPAKEAAFDFVTSLDMLEHVPANLRDKVVSEMIRVSKIAAIIIAPIASSENVWAEDFVLRYRHADFLIEHKDQGLVDFSKIEAQLARHISEGKIKSYERFELDNLLTWVSMMTEDFCDTSLVYKECYEKLENKFVPRRIALIIHKA